MYVIHVTQKFCNLFDWETILAQNTAKNICEN